MFGDIFDSEVNKKVTEFKFDTYTIPIVCVSGENQHVDKWVPLVVWKAAEIFGKQLIKPEMKECLHHKRIIELGSGTGVCGLLAANISESITLLTDGSEDSIEYIEESIELNHLEERVKCSQLMWGDLPSITNILKEFGEFEICIATDVIYDAIAVGPLLITAGMMLEKNGIFFLANHRYRFAGLLKEIEKEVGRTSLKLIEVSRFEDEVDFYKFQKV